MSEFSLDSNVNIPINKLRELSSVRYDDISALIYTTVSLNSPMDELFFLCKYISSVATKYQAILEYCGHFINRKHVQKYVDTVAAVTMATVFEYSKLGYNLPETISFFINQFLKIVYEKCEFNIIVVRMLHGPSQVRFKILIEPILSETERKLSNKDVEFSTRMMLTLLSYLESPDKCISCSIIKSDLWSEKSEYIPEIIDDNIFPGLFEQYPVLYKIIFKKRHELLDKLGITSIDISDSIKLSKEFEDVITKVYEEDLGNVIDFYKILNNIYDKDEDNKGLEEIEEDPLAFDELIHDQFFTNIIEMLYLKITSSDFPITVSINDIVKSSVLDTPVYHNIYDSIMTGDFDSWSIVKSIKKYYECEDDSEDDSDFFKPKGIDEKNINNLKRNSRENLENNRVLKETIKNDKQLINISNVQYNIPSNSEGFSKLIFDYHDKDEIQKIIDLSNYISETLSLYIKTKDKFNQLILNKIISSYNKAKIEIIDIKNDKKKENYTVQFNMFDKLYRFTISKKDGIIKLIEYKEG